ncbi:MAG: hypothetical protein JJU11_12570, partial [Candidatus Sumerlaeia bacterium]|nr:hypothetical protein [Candidatus Sumerlaeia bacterium]
MGILCLFVATPNLWAQGTDGARLLGAPVYEAVSPEVRADVGFDPAHSRAVFVGINQFSDPSLAPVAYAVDDAIDLAHFMAFHLNLIEPSGVVLAIQGNPAKATSRERLAELV